MTPRTSPESSNSQRARILRLLIESRGNWIPSPEIAACAQQYNARLFELRRLGFVIVNRTAERDGVRLSWFRLVAGPTQTKTPPPAVERASSPSTHKTRSAGDVTSEPAQDLLPFGDVR